MKYSSVTIESKGGRIVQILKDRSVEPGDVDYYMYYDGISDLIDKIHELNRKDTTIHDKSRLIIKPSYIDELLVAGVLIEPDQ